MFYNIALTSMLHHDVASTLMQRCLIVACPLVAIDLGKHNIVISVKYFYMLTMFSVVTAFDLSSKMRLYNLSRWHHRRSYTGSLIRETRISYSPETLRYLLYQYCNKTSRNIRKRKFGHVCQVKIQISLRIHAVWSETSLGVSLRKHVYSNI